jgi:hypothetical protein
VAAPITWDFDKIRANLGRERAEKRIVALFAAQPPVLDGRLGPGEWERTDVQTFSRYKDPEGRIPDRAVTRVRVMYDRQNLYVAYECVEPMIGQLKRAAVGRDGDVWFNDEVELFLNPDETSNSKCMQFMASPIENAFYDARKGYAADPLNPEAGEWQVRSWQPDWQYAFNIDKGAKVWTLEMAIRFAGLDAPPPTEGTVWRGNFGRARRAHGLEDLSCWEPMTFGADPELFGDIVFGSAKGAKADGPLAPATAGSTADENVIVNPGFEKVAADGRPEAWRIKSWGAPGRFAQHCSLTAELAHSGERSLKTDYTDADFGSIGKGAQVLWEQSLSRDVVNRLAGKKVVLSAWIRFEPLDHEATGQYTPGPYLFVRAWDDKGRPPLNPEQAPRLIVTKSLLADRGYVTGKQLVGKWVKVEQQGLVPPGTKRMDLHCGFVAVDPRTGRKNRSTVYVDDIRLALLSVSLSKD